MYCVFTDHTHTASTPTPHTTHPTPCRLDLRDVRVVSKVGGTLDDSELVQGTVFEQKASKGPGGIGRVENAKIALIQFCVSPPKTDIENNVVISDYAQVLFCGVGGGEC